ncbi:MAG: Na+/H+ antiporter subunit E [Alphaproteobacteria bacterium]
MDLLRFGIILSVALAVFWISLSGYFTPMLLTLGGISIFLVLGLCFRMNILDRETAPYLSLPGTLKYLVWLSAEIVKANMAVVRAVLKPDMEISPAIVKVPVKQTTDIGKTMFANSITLTPGTVSMAINEDEIVVHALLSEMTDLQGFAEMGERSARSVGEKGTQS